ncbi:GNAT family N-acetyltransferase [Pontiella sp.]|uniref:GNAT family N-acetyltransferase n=2 Tax=Pontiella sp. TaxID=2837462 RepID=UPI003562679A
MSGRIQIERLEHGPHIAALEPEWEALLRDSVRPTLFSSFDYVQTSLRHLKGGGEVFYLLFREAGSGKLLALFPLSLWNQRVHRVALRVVMHALPPPTTEADKPCPIIHRDHEAECWARFADYFRNDFRAWDMMVLDELIATSHLPGNAERLFPFPGYWTRSKPGPDSPIVKLDGEWEDFWNRHRKLRKKCGRLERRIENLSYRVTGDPADVEPCLKAYIETEQASWKEGEMVARHHRFYEELLPKLAAKGQLWFGMMHDAAKVVSVEVAYAYLDKVYFCHGTFLPEYGEHSPGMVNSCWFVRHFHGKGFSEGDYLAGFADYVNPWAHRLEQTRNVVVRRVGWKTGYLAVWHLFGKLKRRWQSRREQKRGANDVAE